MRTDVKVGVLLSLVVVVGAGWYYLRKDSSRQSVPLDEPVATFDLGQESSSARADVIRRDVDVDPPAVEDSTSYDEPRLADVDTKPVDVVADSSAPLSADSGFVGLIPVESDQDDYAQPIALPRDLDDPVPANDIAKSGDSGRSTDWLGSGALTASPPSSAVDSPVNSLPKPTTTLISKKTRIHTVEPGDTLCVLAEVYYGSQKFTNVLLRANPQLKNPDRLLVGTVLKVPELNKASLATASKKTVATQANPKPGTYVVSEGDTLYGIAQRILGDGTRWKELFDLNSDRMDGDAHNLRIGQVLKLPKTK